MSSRCIESSVEMNEPLLMENPGRFVLLPIKYPSIWVRDDAEEFREFFFLTG